MICLHSVSCQVNVADELSVFICVCVCVCLASLCPFRVDIFLVNGSWFHMNITEEGTTVASFHSRGSSGSSVAEKSTFPRRSSLAHKPSMRYAVETSLACRTVDILVV